MWQGWGRRLGGPVHALPIRDDGEDMPHMREHIQVARGEADLRGKGVQVAPGRHHLHRRGQLVQRLIVVLGEAEQAFPHHVIHVNASRKLRRGGKPAHSHSPTPVPLFARGGWCRQHSSGGRPDRGRRRGSGAAGGASTTALAVDGRGGVTVQQLLMSRRRCPARLTGGASGAAATSADSVGVSYRPRRVKRGATAPKGSSGLRSHRGGR